MGIKPITVQWGKARATVAERERERTRLAETEGPGALKDKKRPNGLGEVRDARNLRLSVSACRGRWRRHKRTWQRLRSQAR